MKYGGIILNDMSAAPGVSLTFFVQGCPIHCKGCHNPELQNFSGGKEFTEETMKTIIMLNRWRALLHRLPPSGM